jgi:hypothetical protein
MLPTNKQILAGACGKAARDELLARLRAEQAQREAEAKANAARWEAFATMWKDIGEYAFASEQMLDALAARTRAAADAFAQANQEAEALQESAAQLQIKAQQEWHRQFVAREGDWAEFQHNWRRYIESKL